MLSLDSTFAFYRQDSGWARRTEAVASEAHQGLGSLKLCVCVAHLLSQHSGDRNMRITHEFKARLVYVSLVYLVTASSDYIIRPYQQQKGHVWAALWQMNLMQVHEKWYKKKLVGPTAFWLDLIDIVITYLYMSKGSKKKGLREILVYSFS